MIDFDAILAAQRKTVDVPGLGVAIYARPLMEATANRLLSKVYDRRNERGTIEEDEQIEADYVAVLAAALEYENGELAFNSDKGRAFLMRQPMLYKQRMMAAVLQANGDPDAKVTEKNSETPTATSA